MVPLGRVQNHPAVEADPSLEVVADLVVEEDPFREAEEVEADPLPEEEVGEVGRPLQAVVVVEAGRPFQAVVEEEGVVTLKTSSEAGEVAEVVSRQKGQQSL